MEKLIEFLKTLTWLAAIVVVCAIGWHFLKPSPVVVPLPSIMTNINNQLHEVENAKTKPDNMSTNRDDNVSAIRDMLKRIYR